MRKETRQKKRRILLAALLLTVASTTLQVAAQTTTMCNPMNLQYRFVLGRSKGQAAYREAADPTMVTYNGHYYLFPSKCGGYYRSDNLADWTLIKCDSYNVEGYAPAVVNVDGTLYLTTSVGTGIVYRCEDIDKGEWEVMTNKFPWGNLADPTYLYSDGRLFMYAGSSGDPTSYIEGFELNPSTFMPINKTNGRKNLVSVDKDEFGWECPGDYNENRSGTPWLEGAWATEHDGKYYLQCSVPGTESRSYTDGVFVSDSPLGTYTAQRQNPLAFRPSGFICGTGHGSTFQDLYGNYWHVGSGTISKRHMFERRLVLNPVFFDGDGVMYSYTTFGDWPMKMPTKKISSPEELTTGWMLLSYKKSVEVSSSLDGYAAENAVDEDIRTWWSAASGNAGEWLKIDLGSVCTINAVQLNFADHDADTEGFVDGAYQYTVEVSRDGNTWTNIIDKSQNTLNSPHEYTELSSAVEGRYVRVTNKNCPCGNFSISGLRVFGKGHGSVPASVDGLVKVNRTAADARTMKLTWNAVDGAVGYNVRFGVSPDKLYNVYQVLGDNSVTINSLNASDVYYYSIDAFNENGLTKNGIVGTVAVPGVALENGTSSDCGDGTFSNPVIYADVPDVDVIRVDDTFYMVSTTMHYSPGCPIMKSKDLVNWKIIGYAHDQLEETDGYALKNGKSDYASGSWAANLRYDKYEKRFYLIVTCNSSGHSYIFTTTDIEHGPWHRNTLDLCYDPGLLFDDNGKECKKYVVYPNADLGKHESNIRTIISDGNGGVTFSEPTTIIDYANLENPAEGLRAEGYHGYKIGDYYYIFMIQGVGAQRQEIVWRSKTLESGSFVGKKVFAGNIKNSDGSEYLPFTGIAQGGIVDTQDGRWYAMLFQDYGAVGRIPVLMPMVWDEDGWPVIGNDGESASHIYPKPVQGEEMSSIVVDDEFDNVTERYLCSDKYASNEITAGLSLDQLQDISEEEVAENEYGFNGSILKREWQWNHNPNNNLWSLTDREGWLRLKSGLIAPSIQQARNTLTQRTIGPTSAATTQIDVSRMNEGDAAGLCSFQNQYGYVGVEVKNGKKMIVMRRATAAGDADGTVIKSVPLYGDSLYLRVCCDFTDKRDVATFCYSLDGNSWHAIGDELHMAFDWPHFVGQRFALFYYSTKQTGGCVDFNFFHVTKDITTDNLINENDTVFDHIDCDTVLHALNGGAYTLPIYAVMKSGLTKDIAAECTYSIDDASIASVLDGTFTGLKEGTTNCTAYYEAQDGSKASHDFRLSVETFPLTDDLFNPAIDGKGSFDATTKTFTSTTKAFGGWLYNAGLDLRQFPYIVVELAEKPSTSTAFVMSDGVAEYTRTLTSATTKIRLANASKVNLDNITEIGFRINGTGELAFNRIFLSNDGTTPSGIANVINNNNGTSNDKTYDLQGRNIYKPNGIYIQNGKKFIRGNSAMTRRAMMR